MKKKKKSSQKTTLKTEAMKFIGEQVENLKNVTGLKNTHNQLDENDERKLSIYF